MRMVLATRVACAALLAMPNQARGQQDGPNVDLWLDNGGSLDRGTLARVHYAADPGSYITIVRLDTDGRMTVVVPAFPGSRSSILSSAERLATFTMADEPGVGQLVAIAARTPFDFRRYRGRDGHWLPIASQGRIDAGTALTRFVQDITKGQPYSLAMVDYHVSDGRDVTLRARPGIVYDDYRHGRLYDLYDLWYDDYGDYWRSDSRHRSRYRRGNSYRYGTPNHDPRYPNTVRCADGTIVRSGMPCPISPNFPPSGTGTPHSRLRSSLRRPTPPRIPLPAQANPAWQPPRSTPTPPPAPSRTSPPRAHPRPVTPRTEPRATPVPPPPAPPREQQAPKA